MAAHSQKKSNKKKFKDKNVRNKSEIKRIARQLNWQKFKTTKSTEKIDQNVGQSKESFTISSSKPKTILTQQSRVDKKSKSTLTKTKVKLGKLSRIENPHSSSRPITSKSLTSENSAHNVVSTVPVQTSPAPVQYNISVSNKFEGIDTIGETVQKNRFQKENLIPLQYPDRLAVTGYEFFTQPDIVSIGGVAPQITPDPCVAIDCEMVGIGSGREHMLARVSMVNMSGQCIYDTFVSPQAPIVDYRTFVSGIRPEHVNQGVNFHVVRRVVATLLSNRILVGHSVLNDLKVLYLKYPKKYTRDTANYKPFRKTLKIKSTPSLKRLAKEILNIDIQGSEHSSIEDARAAMSLYVQHREEWEKLLRDERTKRRHH